MSEDKQRLNIIEPRVARYLLRFTQSRIVASRGHSPTKGHPTGSAIAIFVLFWALSFDGKYVSIPGPLPLALPAHRSAGDDSGYFVLGFDSIATLRPQ